MSRLKNFLQDFPGTNATVAAAIVLVLLTGLIVCAKLALGQPFPSGYDTWIWALVALCGVNVAGVVGKRLTDVEYKKAGTSPVTVGGPSTVTVATAPSATTVTADADKDKA